MTKCTFLAPDTMPFTITLKNIPSVGEEVFFNINERCSTGPEFFSGKVLRRVFKNDHVVFYCDGAW